VVAKSANPKKGAVPNGVKIRLKMAMPPFSARRMPSENPKRRVRHCRISPCHISRHAAQPFRLLGLGMVASMMPMFFSTAHATQSQVATPVLSVRAGNSTSNITVTITDATAGAALYYTTNGVAPTSTNAPSLSSGQSLTIPIGTKLKVRGFLNGSLPSTLITATYTASGILSASGQSTLALKNDGTLWAWGNNTTGQLGLGASGGTNVSKPTQVPLPGVGALPIPGLTSKSIAYENGLSVPWEIQYFGSTGQDPNALAPSGNGLTILQAYQQGLSPLASSVATTDSDGDGIPDVYEIAHGLDPHDSFDASKYVSPDSIITQLQAYINSTDRRDLTDTAINMLQGPPTDNKPGDITPLSYQLVTATGIPIPYAWILFDGMAAELRWSTQSTGDDSKDYCYLRTDNQGKIAGYLVVGANTGVNSFTLRTITGY